ncbi:MAG: nucleoside phosphorylase [Flammeovirgaceae bacterium]
MPSQYVNVNYQFPESELILNKDGSVYHLNIKPEHLSDTVLAVGDPGRVHRISRHFDKVEFEMNKREFVTHVGYYKGKRLTVMSTGMGTDNIEIFLTELDALANIDLKYRKAKEEHRSLNIIRIGTSGAMQEDLVVGTTLVSDYAIGLDTLMCFYKLEQTEFESIISDALQERLQLPFRPYCVQGSTHLRDVIGKDMVFGNTLTAPGFYAPQGRKLRLALANPDMINDIANFSDHKFWITNFEMETAGYYAMARLLGHRAISVNAIIANRISNTFAKETNKVVDQVIKQTLEQVLEL